MKKNDEVFLEIKDLGKSGEGIAYYENKKIFIKYALLQEKVIAKITQVKKEYCEAEIISIIKQSPSRIKPTCSKFTDCGACNLMHIDYESQLNHKRDLICNALSIISYLNQSIVLSCIASPKQLFYRNKVQLPLGFAKKVICGFYKEKSHDIIPYTECLVHDEAIKDAALIITDCISQENISIYSESTHEGLLRHFIIRINNKKEMLIGLVATYHDLILNKLSEKIMERLINAKGIILSINKQIHNKILGDEYRLLQGQEFLVEEICGLKFKLSLPSFFQINRLGAEILYSTALEFANLKISDKVLDAYCGVGTLSLLAATKCQEVVGVELVEEAIIDARNNALENQIENANFVCGLVQEQVNLFKDIDVAFVNPPRKGIDEEVIKAVDNFGPAKIIYISCNPYTLAKDISHLKNYRLIKLQPIDMFPQTIHVECLALIERD